MKEKEMKEQVFAAAIKALESLRLESLELFPEDSQDEERFHFFVDVWQSGLLLIIGKFVHEEYRLKVSDNILKILKKNIKAHNAQGNNK